MLVCSSHGSMQAQVPCLLACRRPLQPASVRISPQHTHCTPSLGITVWLAPLHAPAPPTADASVSRSFEGQVIISGNEALVTLPGWCLPGPPLTCMGYAMLFHAVPASRVQRAQPPVCAAQHGAAIIIIIIIIIIINITWPSMFQDRGGRPPL
jgi:hypothetical protein